MCKRRREEEQRKIQEAKDGIEDENQNFLILRNRAILRQESQNILPTYLPSKLNQIFPKKTRSTSIGRNKKSISLILYKRYRMSS